MLPTQNYNGLQFQQPSSLATINIPNSIDMIEAVTETFPPHHIEARESLSIYKLTA